MPDHDYLCATKHISEGLKARTHDPLGGNRRYSNFDSMTTLNSPPGKEERDDSRYNYSASAETGAGTSKSISLSTEAVSGHAVSLLASHPHGDGSGNISQNAVAASFSEGDISHV